MKAKIYETIDFSWNRPVVKNVQFSSLSELKAKAEAFELLFERTPVFIAKFFIESNGFFEAERMPDGSVWEGYCYGSQVENCKTFVIRNKYIVFDNKMKFAIRQGAKIEVSFY